MIARLYLFAEGQTEQTFANNVLKPHLASHGVYLGHVVQIAHAFKKGRTHRGGGRNHGAMKRDILRFTQQERGRDVFFTSMVDLYSLHHDFPGRQVSENLPLLPYERVASLENSWLIDVADPRFIPYIQLHEFEACLFAAPGEFELFYSEAPRNLRRLKEIAQEYPNPELINDGPETAPSKRILGIFPDYQKAVVGPQVAELIGLDRIRAKCPHFEEWLTKLERLGSTTAPAI